MPGCPAGHGAVSSEGSAQPENDVGSELGDKGEIVITAGEQFRPFAAGEAVIIA
jgi:hypothetical protein